MIQANLPALQVVLPLLLAPVCFAISKNKIAWLLTTLVVWSCLAVSVALIHHVFSVGNISYEMGGWAPPFGIEYYIDKLSALVIFIVCLVASILMPYAYESVKSEIAKEKQPLFYSMFLLCFAGLLGIVATNDAFNVYVFFEISSLATYALIAMGSDRRALMAAFEYLILGTIGATFILIAVGLLYMMTGTLNISDLYNRIPLAENQVPIKAALAFFTIGALLKIAFFPLHLWLTNAYTNAPSFVSSFLSATATKVSFVVLVKVLFLIFGYQFSFEELPIGQILAVLSVFAILIGSIAAIFQHNIKRLLAYSSLAQMGYIVLGFSLATTLGITASFTHLTAHALAKAVLFMSIGCVVYRCGKVRMADVKGFGKTMPYTALAFLIAGLSLIGVPGTAGFISKWLLLEALIDKGLWPIIFVVLLSSLLAIIYIWKIIEVAYFASPDKNVEVKEAPASMLLSMFVLVALTVVLGFYSQPMTVFTSGVAEYLMGVR